MADLDVLQMSNGHTDGLTHLHDPLLFTLPLSAFPYVYFICSLCL